MSQTGPLKRSFDGDDGFGFVVCRICGAHRRVINSQHLSKHDTDRATYMQEYDLSPDELTAKEFRIIQSSRRGYYPNGKSEWIATVKKVYEKDGNVFAGYLQSTHSISIRRLDFRRLGQTSAWGPIPMLDCSLFFGEAKVSFRN